MIGLVLGLTAGVSLAIAAFALGRVRQLHRQVRAERDERRRIEQERKLALEAMRSELRRVDGRLVEILVSVVNPMNPLRWN